jgi:nucleoside-diphosphate-sugar epimerase
MDTVLITGGAGFIGSHIAERLLAQGCTVVVLDDLSTGRRENIDHLLREKKFTFVSGSTLDSALLRSVIRLHGVSHICHQAAVPSVAMSVLDPVTSTEANVMGTVNVFDVAVQAGCKRVVFASSASVYGDAAEMPVSERAGLDPRSPYAVSKATKEMLAGVFSRLYGIEIVCLRYFNVYGRRQDPASDYAAVVPLFISRALRDEPLVIEGDGRQTRDFIHVDDVVQANVRALTREDLTDRLFNIGCGERLSILDLARTIKAAVGSRSEIQFRPGRQDDVRDSLANIDRARTGLGYEPQYDIHRGLAETVPWYQEARELTCAA